MPGSSRRVLRRFVPVLLVAAVALGAVAPTLGFSHGICTGCAGGSSAPPGDFATVGCIACHGPAPGHSASYAPGATDMIHWTFVDDKGKGMAGDVYDAHAKYYTVSITLNETNKPDKANHAGFNLRASAGKLEGVAGQSQAAADGSQATHVDPTRTSWQVKWTPPASGVAVFDLFVNDVDGSGLPDAGDQVHNIGFFLKDESHGLPGAKTEAVEYGISLQQYWIGLIGLTGMIFVMIAGFVYLKFVNPHNTDQKDR